MKLRDVANLLDLAPDTVRKLTREGLIPGRVIERPRRSIYVYSEPDVMAFLRSGEPVDEFSINLEWMQ